MSHHGGASSKELEHIVRLLVKLTRRPSMRSRARLYVLLMKAEVAVGAIDALLEAIVQSKQINQHTLYQEALWMAKEAAHRGVVKFGIALLGLYPIDSHLDVLFVLGAHEEFTLYAAVAIQNQSSNVNELLFQLAQKVDGWGKIQIVERLEPSTAEIRQWLLEHGCANHVMPEYLACICAKKGHLHQALEQPDISKALYEGAGVIVSALVNGRGPAEDIDEYEHGPAVVSDYLRHSLRHAATLVHFQTVTEIRDFLKDSDPWRERYERGWSA